MDKHSRQVLIVISIHHTDHKKIGYKRCVSVKQDKEFRSCQSTTEGDNV